MKFGVVPLASILLAGSAVAATNAAAAISQAAALARGGNRKQAETILRSAVAKDPDSADLHGALGKLLFSEENYTDSVQELNQAQLLDPDSRGYNMMLAAALLGAKRYGVARNFLLAIQPRFEQYPEFHYSLGLAYYDMADSTKAEKELREALRLDPKLDRARFLLAACVATDGDFAKAAAILRALTKDDPRNVIYWTTLGDILRQAGRANQPEALRACHRALAIEPGNAHAQFVLATVLLDAGDFAGARPLLEHLEQVSPDELEAHIALARVYGRLGKPELARKETDIVNKLREQQQTDSPPAPPGNESGNSERH